jgi:DNA-binding LacI/PurR family transcriptional regulator
MGNVRILSASEQVAEHLRSELLSGRLADCMPGEDKLIAQLGVGRATVQAAVRQLEKEGYLVSQGVGKRRLITLPEDHEPPTMRIAILLYGSSDAKTDYPLDLLHQLGEEGHTAFFAPKTLSCLNMDVKKVAKFVNKIKADAWVILAGSRSVLDWFAAQAFPAFALFGRSASVPIASTGPRKLAAIRTAVQLLISLGHRRIVMISREERRKPSPGLEEQAFLDELQAQGVPTGPYNLPDWEESPAGYHRLLESLFKLSPPTALLIDGTSLPVATLQHFAKRGIDVPRDVSLICSDPDPAFDSCDPAITHISHDSRPWVRRIVRWANNVARGKDDRRQNSFPAKLVEGGTVGPAPKT